MITRILLFTLCTHIMVNAQESEIIEIEDIDTRAKIPCTTRYHNNGYCLRIDKCRKIVSQIRPFRNQKICYFEGEIRYVCCPVRIRGQTTPKSTRATTPRPRTRTTSRSRRSTTRRTAAWPNSAIPKDDLNLPECGQRFNLPDHGSAFVVGGTEAEMYSWPWMVAIRIKTFGQNTGFLCGGSLITPKHVLTAAHCFEGLNKYRSTIDYKIILGSHYRESGSPNAEEESGIIIVTPADIAVHEGYRSDSNDYDIAVVALDISVRITDRVRPVCLPQRSKPQDLEQVTVIGWGDTSYGGFGSKALQEAKFEVIEFARCQRIFRAIPKLQITENMLCAGDVSGAKDACQNDSGGPLLAETNEENKWIQVGIVSFGYRCAERGFPGVYTKVSNFIPWIQRQIRR